MDCTQNNNSLAIMFFETIVDLETQWIIQNLNLTHL